MTRTTPLLPSTSKIWPLRRGRKSTIEYRNVVRGRDNDYRRVYRQSWRCRVSGTETVTVIGGSFDTYRVDCQRRDGENRRLGRRTWYYAPEIGHYVKRVDSYAYDNFFRRCCSVYYQPV